MCASLQAGIEFKYTHHYNAIGGTPVSTASYNTVNAYIQGMGVSSGSGTPNPGIDDTLL